MAGSFCLYLHQSGFSLSPCSVGGAIGLALVHTLTTAQSIRHRHLSCHFCAFNGLIGLTRSYGRGLDLTRLEQGVDLYALANTGVSETGVFLASSAVIANSPSPNSPYVGLQPFVATLLFPIPRTLFPSNLMLPVFKIH